MAKHFLLIFLCLILSLAGLAEELGVTNTGTGRQWSKTMANEWLNRASVSKVNTCLPVFKKENVGCMHWGLVNGKTQTHLHYGSRPGAETPAAAAWQHDIYRGNHEPYDENELRLFRGYTGKERKAHAGDANGTPDR